MNKTTIQKYAQLLVDYCLSIKEGDKLFIRSSFLAEPLLREVYRYALSKGAIVEMDIAFQGKTKIYFDEASEHALRHKPILQSEAIKNFDAYLFIRAPYNLMENQNLNKEKQKISREAMAEINELYNIRTADLSLRRTLCQFPTQAAAQMAKMSLEEYENFVFNACYLFEDKPQSHWEKVGQSQQRIVDLLNTKSHIRYKNDRTDIHFSVEGRNWINSDGKTNMPSGEVFSAPIEDSVQGQVYFSLPSIYAGNEVAGVELTVKDGKVVNATAEKGQEFLEKILTIKGANYFGEVAIGTNYQIQQVTGNILFDEKIGGTIHMALGNSYMQCGGKNKSSIHWDMITEMKNGGEIYADDELIYQNGKFIF